MSTYDADICIYGATSGGIMSAWKAARMGMKISILATNTHIGGMTTGGLSFMDINSLVPKGDLLQFYHTIESGNRNVIDISKQTWADQPEISPIVYSNAFDKIFTNHTDKINLYTNQQINGITMLSNTISTIQMSNGNIFSAKIFIDASYEGDLLKYSGVPYSMIRESSSTYGETQAGIRIGGTTNIDAYNTRGDSSSGIIGATINGIQIPNISPDPVVDGEESKDLMENTYRLCITNITANMLGFSDDAFKPPSYDAKDYEILLRYCESQSASITATNPMPQNFKYSWPVLSKPGKPSYSNYHDWNGNYWLLGMCRDYLEDSNGNIDYAKRTQIEKATEYWQRGILYTLATNPRVHHITRNQVSNWGLATDQFVSNNYWPTCFYLRESRRMISDYILKNITDPLASRHVISESKYMLDAHSSSLIVKNGKLFSEGGIPIQNDLKNKTIPYETIIPPRCKCVNLFVTWSISASRLAFTSIRMEPVFMQISLAAGAAAALCIINNYIVQDLPFSILNPYIYNTPLPVSPSIKLNYTPFESLSVIRQSKDIPMLFSIRIAKQFAADSKIESDILQGFDAAGMPIVNTEKAARIIQIGKYAYDNLYSSTNDINQYCLSSNDRGSNLSTFYGSHLQKEVMYSCIDSIPQSIVDTITNSSLTPPQKKSQFITSTMDFYAKTILDPTNLRHHITYCMLNEVYSSTKIDPATGVYKVEDKDYLMTGVAIPTQADLQIGRDDKHALYCKAWHDSSDKKKTNLFGGYGFEDGTPNTTLKTYLDKARYVNNKYFNTYSPPERVVAGIMAQAHISLDTNLSNTEKYYNIIRSEGHDLVINEFDFLIFPKTNLQTLSGNIITNVGTYITPAHPNFNTMLIRQATLYSNFVKICLNQGAVQFQVWGDYDMSTWIDNIHFTHIKDAGVWRSIRVGDTIPQVLLDYKKDRKYYAALFSTIAVTQNVRAVIQKSYSTMFDENIQPKPCYYSVLNLLKNYDITDYNSKKSIFPPYNVLTYTYDDL